MRKPLCSRSKPLRNCVAARLVIALALSAGEPAIALDRAEERARSFIALTEAAGAGDLALVRQLLASGVDPQHPPEGGTTKAQYFASLRDPVQSAAAGGHTEVVEALIRAGADPDWVCCSGETALEIAAERGHTDTVRLLLEKQDANPFILALALNAAVIGRHPRTAAALVPAALFPHCGNLALATLALVALVLLWRSVRGSSPA